MFFIPGILIAVLTFPGVIVHEFAHQIACRIMKVPVFKVCYFQFERPNGYVIHEKTKTFAQTLVIAIGPFIVNTLIGVMVFIPGRFSMQEGLIEYFLMWLGISIVMHAFPSKVDLDSIFVKAKEEKPPFILKVLVYPLTILLYIGSVGSVVWLDLGYSIGMVYLAERLIVAI